MSMVTVDNLKLSFADRYIFDGDSVQIGFRERIGLIGPNGTGKTTLLKVLAKKQHIDEGNIHIQRGIRVGYLPQDVLELPKKTLRQLVLESVPGKKQLKREIKEAETDLNESDDPDEQTEIAGRLAELHEMFDHTETFYSDHEADRILLGLGFKESDFPRPLSEFSGGWKMRAALAGLLFQKPDLLLLDEPTNHLDVPSVRWLEVFLENFPNTILLISHDREFLDRQVSRILSLEPEGIRSYPGNYTRYKELREEEVRVIDAHSKHQEKKRKEIERFIVKYRANKPKARQAQSRVKLLRKMEEIKTLSKPVEIKQFRFPPVERTVQDVVKLRGIGKSFGEQVLYKKLNLTIQRGDRIAIIGVNGIGKTTLLKILAGEMEQTGGEVKLGTGIRMGYYAQHQTEKLRLGATILEEVWNVVPTMSQSFVRGVCGAFLFPGDDVEKKIDVLSGGEKARVALSKLLVKSYNLLVMDEPTNHLDLYSSEALAEALEEYEGTLLFVSHNQAFVNRLATKVWNIENGRIDEYPGNLADYLYHMEQVELSKAEQGVAGKDKARAAKKPKKTPGRLSKEERKEQRKKEAQIRKKYGRDLSSAKKKVKELEARVATLEDRQAELSTLLADPEIYKDGEQMKPLLNEFDENKRKLEELMGRWENKQAKLEKLEENPPEELVEK